MKSIYIKEILSFFSSIIGYVVISVFLIVMGLFSWVFQDTSILSGSYANLDPLFSFSPLIFIFLIPAITMRSFSEEYQSGTIEILRTKPLSSYQILFGKFLSNVTIVLLAILPTVLYIYSVYQLGIPKGNLDKGAIIGSYIGLVLLTTSLVSIGIFSSLLSNNQIVSFLIAALLCFIMLYAFEFISTMPIFYGSIDDVIEEIGINYHYASISKGLLKSEDLIYFISVISIFLYASWIILNQKRI